MMVVVSALLPGSPPNTSDSAAKVVKFFADQGDEIRWAGYIGLLATIPLFWWLSSVWRLMRRWGVQNTHTRMLPATHSCR